MSLKKTLPAFIFLAGFYSCTSTKKMETIPQVDNVLTTPQMFSTDSFSYAAGVNIASNMKAQGVESINASLLAEAMNAVFQNDSLKMNEEQAMGILQQKLQAFSEAKAAKEAAKNKAFLNENKTKPGVISLPNGLQYIILEPGMANGMKPNPSDTVVVDYVGTLTNGQEFDNSIARGEPATFPLNGVIKGWTEILQLMPTGSKWKVFIPSDLGYGERGAGQAIPPNATLVFEIKLLDIKKSTTK